MNELIMLVGLPASGKSTWAKAYVEANPEYILHSSDKLRREMYGDNFDDSDNNKVFEELHRRILEDLKTHSVIYDATNLVKKRRVHFLKQVSKQVYKTCVVFLKTYEKCLEDNLKREIPVPDEVITRMRKTFSPPMCHEGFNEIRVVQDDCKDLNDLIDMTRDFDQENPHHTLTLYGHLKKVSAGVPTEDSNLWVAAWVHDIGKLFTKSRINKKGEEDDYCHYYQHHCVGAYEFLTSCDFSDVTTGKDMFDIFYIANLIYYHMHPYLSWAQSRRARNKDKRLIGDKMFSDVMLLHEADVNGH
jgi:predicted kinase